MSNSIKLRIDTVGTNRLKFQEITPETLLEFIHLNYEKLLKNNEGDIHFSISWSISDDDFAMTTLSSLISKEYFQNLEHRNLGERLKDIFKLNIKEFILIFKE